jgi:hypothetical protein
MLVRGESKNGAGVCELILFSIMEFLDQQSVRSDATVDKLAYISITFYSKLLIKYRPESWNTLCGPFDIR